MEVKNEEKKSGAHCACGNFFGYCFKNRIVRVILGILIVFTLFSMGVSFGSHMVGRYSRMGGEGDYFSGRNGSGGCQGAYQGKTGKMHRRDNRGANFMMRGQGQTQGTEVQIRQRGVRMINNAQFGPDGTQTQSPEKLYQTNDVNSSSSGSAPVTPNVQ